MKKFLNVLLIIVLVIAFLGSLGYAVWYFVGGIPTAQLQEVASNADREAQHAALVSAAIETTAAPETSETTEAATEPEAQTQEAEVVSDPYGVPGAEGHANEYYTPDEIEEEDVTPVKEDNSVDLLPWYQELHDQNEDMVGWITIDGTKIDYPVMQSSDENANYYLYRSFEKKQSVRGCIYAFEGCDVAKPSDNITLFGHNMKDGSMFNALGRYADQKVWEENPLIIFDTLTESHVYKIFAVFKTSGTDGVGFAYHLMADAEDQNEYDEFIAACKSLSFYDTGITPAYGDKIICLSTCEYTLDNGRFVVAAVRIT